MKKGLLIFFSSILLFMNMQCKKADKITNVDENNDALTLSWNIINTTFEESSDGAIELTVSGGIPPYSFVWSTGATSQNVSGCPVGMYSVEVKDSGTSAITQSFEIKTSIISDEVLDVLFVGNSLTGYNNMPDIVAKFAEMNGKNIIVEQFIRYGQYLRGFYSEQSLEDIIRERKWDYIFFQSDDLVAFDQYYHYEKDSMSYLKNIVLHNNPDTKIFYLMVWPINGGTSFDGIDYTYEEHYNVIVSGMQKLATDIPCEIAPIGCAWNAVTPITLRNSLYDSDRAHPSLRGSYLSACVYYAILFKEKMRITNYYCGIEEDVALYLQNIGTSTVLKK